MQTTNLSNQLLTNAANASQRNALASGTAGTSDGGQFSALLSTELNRSAPAPAPQAAPPQAPKPQAADKPAEAAPQPDGAKPADTTTKAESSDAAKDSDKTDDDDTAKDDQAAATDPAAAMLALMASLKQTAQGANGKAGATDKAYDALAGKGKKTDAAQLSALQAAAKANGKDEGDTTAGIKTFSASTSRNLAAADADLGGAKAADAKATPADGAFNAALSAAKGEAHADTADLTLQQARDAAAVLAAQKDTAPAAVAAAQLQPAALQAAEAAQAASDNLTARVGTEAWTDQVGQKVVYMVGGEEQSATMTLNPPDLGPMQIVLSVSNDQASVTFSSNQQEVRQALENALPRLREMMSESGIALGNATVNAGMSNGGQAQDQSMASSFGRGNGGGSGRGNGNDGGTVVGEATVRPSTRTQALGDRGMVDTFA